MSKKDVVKIVSRAVALYVFCWSFEILSSLPTEIMNVYRFTAPDLHRYYMLFAELSVLRGVVLLAVAMTLYECGPRVQAYLMPREKNAEPVEETPS